MVTKKARQCAGAVRCGDAITRIERIWISFVICFHSFFLGKSLCLWISLFLSLSVCDDAEDDIRWWIVSNDDADD